MSKENQRTEVLFHAKMGVNDVKIWFDETNPVKIWMNEVVLGDELSRIWSVAKREKDIAELVAQISGVNTVEVGVRGICKSYIVHNNRP